MIQVALIVPFAFKTVTQENIYGTAEVSKLIEYCLEHNKYPINIISIFIVIVIIITAWQSEN